MKPRSLLTLVLLVCVSSLVSATVPTRPVYTAAQNAPNKIAGDYVETRNAAVFCGGCHFNGEFVCTGRDAIQAWNFTSGSWNGVNLAGVRVMSAVNGDTNLGDDASVNKSELLFDSSATDAQISAVADLLKSRNASELGTIVNVRRGNVSFSHVGTDYAVKADGFAEMTVQSMPNDECCKQPNLVWYEPLTNLDHRKVGYTLHASYVGGSAGDPWQWEAENSSFYGAFSF
jgi:hypothetical protein